jgi:hypothetical protein
MARKAKPPVANQKPQSVKELKSWLSGILEFQPVDWCPSPEQWKTIQERINNLVEEPVSTVVRYQDTTVENDPQINRQIRQPRQQQQPTALFDDSGASQQQDNSVLSIPEGIPPEILGTSIPGAQVPAVNGSVETLSSRVLVTNGAKAIRTPSVDTSAGNYKSPFG